MPAPGRRVAAHTTWTLCPAPRTRARRTATPTRRAPSCGLRQRGRASGRRRSARCPLRQPGGVRRRRLGGSPGRGARAAGRGHGAGHRSRPLRWWPPAGRWPGPARWPGPLLQGRAEDVGMVAQAGRRVATHDASLCQRHGLSVSPPTDSRQRTRRGSRQQSRTRPAASRRGLRAPLSGLRWRHVYGQAAGCRGGLGLLARGRLSPWLRAYSARFSGSSA